MPYGLLVSWPGIEPRPPALGAWSLSHWTTREVPRNHYCMDLIMSFLNILHYCIVRICPNLHYGFFKVNSCFSVVVVLIIWSSLIIIIIKPFIFLLEYSWLMEKEMATHSSILAWRIPWTEEPGGYSPQGHKESDMTELLTQSSKRNEIKLEGVCGQCSYGS